jgi:hypothetical protein
LIIFSIFIMLAEDLFVYGCIMVYRFVVYRSELLVCCILRLLSHSKLRQLICVSPDTASRWIFFAAIVLPLERSINKLKLEGISFS